MRIDWYETWIWRVGSVHLIDSHLVVMNGAPENGRRVTIMHLIKEHIRFSYRGIDHQGEVVNWLWTSSFSLDDRGRSHLPYINTYRFLAFPNPHEVGKGSLALHLKCSLGRSPSPSSLSRFMDRHIYRSAQYFHLLLRCAQCLTWRGEWRLWCFLNRSSCERNHHWQRHCHCLVVVGEGEGFLCHSRDGLQNCDLYELLLSCYALALLKC